MTREEAIHFAECLKNNWTINFADMEEFCDMAISALKDEPLSHEEAWAEIESDLISREDAIKELVGIIEQIESTEGIAVVDRVTYWTIEDYAKEAFSTIPTVSAERPANGDLISREDAIERVELITKCEWDNNVIYRDEVIDALKFAPSAEAVSREDYHNLLMASNDIDRALREYQAKEESVSAEAVQLKQTDTLIIADALRYLAQDTERHLSDRTRADALREQILKYGASMCHSAEAVPTVIRAKTLMRKEDFDKWAEDIKKQNKSIVCIPCDAEVVSANAVVRCKDCKHRPHLEDENGSDYGFNVRGDEMCPCVNNDDGWYSWMPKANFYCGFGERKGGDSE